MEICDSDYCNIFLSQYRNIVCENVSCETGLIMTPNYDKVKKNPTNENLISLKSNWQNYFVAK